MRLILLAIGRLKDGPERVLFHRYYERSQGLARSLGLSGPEIVEIAESRAVQPAVRMAEEARALFEKIGESRFILLDEKGQTPDSSGFAGWVRQDRDSGQKSLTFVIGGADGLDHSLRSKADRILSFGAMTMPHQLVRILVVEQIYRAMTILSGHPYHRV
jgi:23S rRNA (pseudouridine1915-N3)-methyltransferase